MRAKLTILLTAVLVLALGASQAYGQAGGYDVSREIETVALHGKNQTVGQIQLDYDSNGGIIDAGATLTITFGGLRIAAAGTATCAGGGLNTGCTATLNTDDNATITINSGTPNADDASVSLDGVRVDVSSLEATDSVMATISTSAPSGLIPVGQSRRGTVTTDVGVVAAGLTVGVSAASRLICNLTAMEAGDANGDGTVSDAADDLVPVGGIPMITVTEGFNDAWEDDGRARRHHHPNQDPQSARGSGTAVAAVRYLPSV